MSEDLQPEKAMSELGYRTRGRHGYEVNERDSIPVGGKCTTLHRRLYISIKFGAGDY
jgi:hypothetical protein